MKNLTGKEISRIVINPAIRRSLAGESLKYFFAIYFSDYIGSGYVPAPFHDDFIKLAEDEKCPLTIVLAFRGSAKSTYFSMLYPIWAITGKQKKKFILIITKTQQQAKKIMDNIKNPLENNGLLRSDIGPFEEEGSEWSAMSITLKKYDARIMVASTEQSVRGLLYKRHRPDAVVLDDIEDLASVKSKETRDKLNEWFLGDILGLKDLNTRFFILGTRLHGDDLPSRLIDEIKQGKRDGTYKVIPIVDNGVISWPGKYPDMQAVLEEERRIGNKFAWEREFNMNLIYREEQLIKPEWILHYEKMPDLGNLTNIVIGVDPAISLDEASDFTALVIVYRFGDGKDAKHYISSPIINEKMTFHATSETASMIYNSLPGDYPVTFVVEDVGYQLAAVQEFEEKGIPVERIKPRGQDKYTRASIVSPLFESGRVFFPAEGSKDITDQIIGFPNEKHDDMVDALVYALLRCQKLEHQGEPELYIASILPDGEYRVSSSKDMKFT